MSILSTESIIPAGTNIYHYSRLPQKLLKRGRFDLYNEKHEGAMFFTPEPVSVTNCIVTAIRELRVFNFTNLPDDELALIDEAGGFNNSWKGAVVFGYDGRLLVTNDPYTKISQGVYCDELMIFRDGLQKLGDIRPFSELN